MMSLSVIVKKSVSPEDSIAEPSSRAGRDKENAKTAEVTES